MRKRCARCGFECRLLDASAHFYRRKGRDGYQPRCKPCQRELRRMVPLDRKREYGRRARFAISADAERAAAKREYQRTWMRNARGNPSPERWLENRDTRDVIDAAPIHSAILANEMSHGALARAAGLHRDTIGILLTRDRMRLTTAHAILAALDVLPAEIGI